MPRGIAVDPEIKKRAIAARYAGERIVDIAKSLKLQPKTIGRWCSEVGLPDGRSGKARKKPKKPKAQLTSATSYLAKQLEIVSKMLRAKLPELARFSLTTTADGNTTIEYTVRQLTEVSGSVKL